MTNWVRLWEDMPTDPKWRVIARRAGQSVGNVMAVFNFMMVNAGANETDRGTLRNWEDEDVASALDVDAAVVIAIREAMQGKVLDGDRLKGWEKRQPKREREDNSAERMRSLRERRRDAKDDHVTPSKDATEPGDALQRPRDAKVTPCDASDRPESESEKNRNLSDVPPPEKHRPSDLFAGEAKPTALDEDPKAVLYGAVTDWIAGETGKSKPSVKSAIGKILSTAGGDQHASLVLGMFRDARRERKADPLAWVMGMVTNRKQRAPPGAPPPERSPAFTLSKPSARF